MNAATSVSLKLPADWVELDPREPDLLAELQERIDVPSPLRDEVLVLLAPLAVELGRIAAAADVVLVGLFARTIQVEGDDRPLVVNAHVSLAVSPAIESLEQVQECVEGGTVEPVNLPGGSGVRHTGQTMVHDSTWDEPVAAYMRRYFVPVPGTDRLAALSFLTPNLDLVEQFAEVFDAVAETLQFGYDEAQETSAT